MEIQEAAAKKEELKKAIAKAMNAVMEETGLKISWVKVDLTETGWGPNISEVKEMYVCIGVPL